MAPNDLKGFRFRESTRAPFETEVRLSFDRLGTNTSGYSADISMEGMFVRTQEPKPVGTLVQFEFHLEDQGEHIQGLGDVVWIRLRAAGPDKPAGMGIQYRYLDPHSREAVFKIVDRYLKDSRADRPQNQELNVATPAAPQALGGGPNRLPAPPQAPPPEGLPTVAIPTQGLPKPPPVPLSVPDLEPADVPGSQPALSMDLTELNPETPPVPPVVPPLQEPRAPMLPPMAEMAGMEAAESEAEPSGAKAKWIPLAGVGVVVLVALGAGYMYRQPLLDLLPGGTAPGAERPSGTPMAGGPGEDSGAGEETSSTPAALGDPQDGEVTPAVLDPESEGGVAAAMGDVLSDTSEGLRPSAADGFVDSSVEDNGSSDESLPQQDSLTFEAEPGPVAEEEATAIDRIAWTEDGGATLVTVIGNGAIDPGRVSGFRIEGNAPRYVVRIRGIVDALTAQQIGSTHLRQIRAGIHQVDENREIHLVFDLQDAGVEVVVEALDGDVSVRLSGGGDS